MSALFFEISPMFENQWTGIPIVTSELVRCAAADPDASWTYLYQNTIVDRAVVEEMLARRRGGDYLAHLERQLWAQATLDHDMQRKALASSLTSNRCVTCSGQSRSSCTI
jgi:hypothetical protein